MRKQKQSAARARLQAGAQDTKRLDWLILQLAMASDKTNEELLGKPMNANIDEYRPAIDAAMEAQEEKDLV